MNNPIKIQHRICLVIFATCLAPWVASAQTAAGKKVDDGSEYRTATLAGSETVHVLKMESVLAHFTVQTSWIPGEARKGFFRYQITAGPNTPTADDSAYIEKLHACDFAIRLYDNGGFLLRRIPVVFIRNVDNDGKYTSISSNDIEQLDLIDYKAFLKGSWEMDWQCYGN
jgi:hypothetical protein